MITTPGDGCSVALSKSNPSTIHTGTHPPCCVEAITNDAGGAVCNVDSAHYTYNVTARGARARATQSHSGHSTTGPIQKQKNITSRAAAQSSIYCSSLLGSLGSRDGWNTKNNAKRPVNVRSDLSGKTLQCLHKPLAVRCRHRCRSV